MFFFFCIYTQHITSADMHTVVKKSGIWRITLLQVFALSAGGEYITTVIKVALFADMNNVRSAITKVIFTQLHQERRERAYTPESVVCAHIILGRNGKY